MTEEQRMISLEEKVESIDNTVHAIRDALLGTEYNGAKGFVQRQLDLEKRLAKLEKIWDNGKWFLIGLSLAAGYGASSILNNIATLILRAK